MRCVSTPIDGSTLTHSVTEKCECIESIHSSTKFGSRFCFSAQSSLVFGEINWFLFHDNQAGSSKHARTSSSRLGRQVWLLIASIGPINR